MEGYNQMGQAYLPNDVEESDMKGDNEIDRHHREAAGFGKFDSPKDDRGSITLRFNELERAISELQTSIDGLIVDIGDILGPERDQTPSDEAGMADPEESSMAAHLRRLAVSLRRIDEKVHDTRDRVEF